jgi:ParB-like chromosome segregation protein Spo0J
MMTKPNAQVADGDKISDKSSDSPLDPVDMIGQLPVEEVPLSLLECGLFLRGAGTDPAHVKLLADAASSSKLPPILVQKSNYRVVDGMHRIEAARLRGEKSIRVRFITCTDEDAFILAVKSNTLHGLPLSRSDRIFGAKRILILHPEWSDRAVGAATGLGAKTIAGLRCRSADGTQPFSKRMGLDGKRHPLTAADGRRRAAEYITAHPDAPLRQVAREVDVSLGTVQDVRARMRRGMDPVAVGRQRSSPQPVTSPPAEGPAIGSTTNSRDVQHNSRNPSWTGISSKLMSDPSLRYTEGGRKFFHWMAMYAMHASEWKEFMDAIPAHWLKDVSVVVNDVRDELHHFAEHLRYRQNQAS